MLKKLLKILENYLFPIKCCICLKANHHLCPACRVKIKKVNNFCHLCGQKSKLGLICKKHKREPIIYDACFFLSSNEDYIINKALNAFKFKNIQAMGLILGKTLAKEFSLYWHQRPKEWQLLETVIIPLPISKKVRNKLSFSTSELIALGFSQITGMKIIDKKLKIKTSFFKKEKNFNWSGEYLETALVIVISESMPKKKELEKITKALKKAGAVIVAFVSIIN
jgi:predicted amidophosphoribosyltransferase